MDKPCWPGYGRHMVVYSRQVQTPCSQRTCPLGPAEGGRLQESELHTRREVASGLARRKIKPKVALEMLYASPMVKLVVLEVVGLLLTQVWQIGSKKNQIHQDRQAHPYHQQQEGHH
eukprot:2198889-Pleurochrysis_carterae.AAC.1